MIEQFIKNKFIWKIIIETVFFFLAWLMAREFGWEIESMIFFAIFLIFILHPIPAKIPAFMVIILLIVTAILSAMKKNDQAETMAIWSYYLMILTLFMAIFEFGKNDRLKECDESDITGNKDNKIIF